MSSIAGYENEDKSIHDHIKMMSTRVSTKSTRELQGPRPSPLKVIKDSIYITKNIRKPAIIIPINHNNSPHQLMGCRRRRRSRQASNNNDGRGRHGQPLVIHLKSPKIIHTRPQDFMVLVQQLTGNNNNNKQSNNASLVPLLVSSSSSSSSAFSCVSTHKINVDDDCRRITCDDEKICKSYSSRNIRDFDIKKDGNNDNYLDLQLNSSSSSCDIHNISSLKSTNILSPNVYNNSNWQDFAGSIF